MLNNQFFKKKGPFPLKKILKAVDSSTSLRTDYEIHGIQDLFHASKNDITFLHSSKYKNDSVNTKALACITSKKLSQYLPSKCVKIIVDNVFFAVAKISKLFYPDGDIDHLDKYLQNSSIFHRLLPGGSLYPDVHQTADPELSGHCFHSPLIRIDHL